MKDISSNFIPSEEAKQLHELGFRDECFAHLIGFGDGTIVGHNYVMKEERIFIDGQSPTSEEIEEDLELHQFGICRVPLWQQAFSFFREKYSLFGRIFEQHHPYMDKVTFCHNYDNSLPKKEFKTYEEAQLECLRILIKLTKDDTKREK